MSDSLRTSLNSSAVQKLYEEKFSKGAKQVKGQAVQHGGGFLTDAVAGVVGNTVKAISAGKRLAAGRAKRARKRKLASKRTGSQMTGKGRGTTRRRFKTKTKTKRRSGGIKRKQSRKRIIRTLKGRGVRRTVKRSRGRRTIRI